MAKTDLKIRNRDLNILLDTMYTYHIDADSDFIKSCYDYACEEHKDQVRLSGEPYITHPLEVAILLAQQKMDTATICAALLHDVVEDTETSIEIIKDKFGDEIANLVDGVTKISRLKSKSRASAQAETLRKMLMASIEDLRIIIIKLADKVHNLRTITFQPPEKQSRIAQEVMDIYAPIAKRLGMTKIGSELENLSFKVLHPNEYEKISKLLKQKDAESEKYIENIRAVLEDKLFELQIKAQITGRSKQHFSIYQKMKLDEKEFDEIYDIHAIRIITEEVKDCYAVLGIIHSTWIPLAGRFKDYIAVPKSNMYRSLHTTVIGPDNHPLEIQIRTREMHEVAEMGIASHWLYKERHTATGDDYKDLTFFSNINKLFESNEDSLEFVSDLKMDLYDEEIFVFTPKGKIIKLAKDSTPVDFAFAIHTEVGLHTSGAKINSKIVPLKTKLKSGDIVDILTTKTAHPSASWLKFIKSAAARQKIRTWLKKHSQIEDNIDPKETTKKSKKETQLIEVKIPEEEQVKIKTISKRNGTGIIVEGTQNVTIKLSLCCQPIPGDDVIGFITRGRGITIHKKTCSSVKRLEKEKERFINVLWEESAKLLYPVKIAIEAVDRPSLLKDISNEVSLAKSNILKFEASSNIDKSTLFKFILEVKSNDHLNYVISKIKKIKNINNVYKLNEKVILK